jgi:hypothetical protein
MRCFEISDQLRTIAADLRLGRRPNSRQDRSVAHVPAGVIPMDLAAAQATLKSLVDGIDPVTGYAIPKSLVLHHAVVIRALLCALAVLEADAARSRRRARLPRNTGRPWRQADDAQVLAAFRSGEPLLQIAADHHRSLASVESRLERLGVLAPEQRVTRNRYVTRAQAAPRRDARQQ